MNNTIGITQFVFLSLGAMALNVVLKVTDRPSAFAQFLAGHGWWLLIIPILWVLLDVASNAVGGTGILPRVSRAFGVLLAAAILACYGYAIFFPGS